MKLFFCVTAKSFTRKDKHFFSMMKVLVHTAKEKTNLDMHCIYRGQEDEYSRYLADNGVTVIHHELSFSGHIKETMSKYGKPKNNDVIFSWYLWYDLFGSLKDHISGESYVLYTDVDCMFGDRFDEDELLALKPRCVAMMEDNTGVLLLNVRGFSKIAGKLIEFAKANMFEYTSDGGMRTISRVRHDESMLNQYLRWRPWKRSALPVIYHWKFYYGDIGEDYGILHFHGIKPYPSFHLERNAKFLTDRFLLDPSCENGYEKYTSLFQNYLEQCDAAQTQSRR